MASSKRQYRLESVRKIREKYRDDAAIVVKNCLGEVEYSKLLISQTEFELKKKVSELRKFRTDVEEESKGGISAADLTLRKEHSNYLRKQCESIRLLKVRQSNELVEREARLADARETLDERIRELKVIEIHAEKWEKDQKQRDLRRDQREIDELGGTFHKK